MGWGIPGGSRCSRWWMGAGRASRISVESGGSVRRKSTKRAGNMIMEIMRRIGALSSNVPGTPLTAAPAFLAINHLKNTIAEPYRLYAVVQPPLAGATVEREPNIRWPRRRWRRIIIFMARWPDLLFLPMRCLRFYGPGGGDYFSEPDCDPLRDNTRSLRSWNC